MAFEVVGLAIQITEDNKEALSYAFEGKKIEISFPLYGGYTLVRPFNPDDEPFIIPTYAFDQNWMYIRPPSPDYLVEIITI